MVEVEGPWKEADGWTLPWGEVVFFAVLHVHRFLPLRSPLLVGFSVSLSSEEELASQRADASELVE